MRRNPLMLIVVSLLSLAFVSAAPAKVSAADAAYWDFDVYLDDKKVGKHFVSVSETDGVKSVQSDATFNVKFLFFSAYRYEHSAAERWTDNCLVRFSASTNANGKRLQVSGEQTGAGFVVETGEEPIALPDCVMTFAYWNPDFLNQPRLLNPQTGEYLDVRVENFGSETLEVRGQSVVARRFKLTARKVDVTLWYSSDDKWLALESVAEGGRTIRYELS